MTLRVRLATVLEAAFVLVVRDGSAHASDRCLVERVAMGIMWCFES